MRLPTPDSEYSKDREHRRNATLERSDRMNRKKGEDVEIMQGEKLVLQSPNGALWQISVSDDGSLNTDQL